MKNKEIVRLVKKVQKNKEIYFEELYKEIWGTVNYFCYKHLGNEQDAKDAAQTVLIKLYNQIQTLKNPEAFHKFLRTIMTHTCNDFHRKNYRNEADELDEYEEVLPEDNSDFLPEEAFERQDVRQEIAKMISELPAKQREAILLFYLEGMSIKEIAEMTHSGVNAVNNRLVTARKSLRAHADDLSEKGVINRIMAIVPILVITRILLDEAQAINTPEVCDALWQGVCGTLGLAAGAAAATATATTAATTAGTTATVTTASSGFLFYACVTLICAAVLATGTYFTYYVNQNFINPIEIVYDDEYENYEDYDGEYYIATDFGSLITPIASRPELIDFINEHDFRLVGGERSTEFGTQMLYYLEYFEHFIYVGYTICLQNNFRITYEIADSSLPRITSEDVPAWFARQQI
ncbi:MAG: sigma-70 family RNA polymerase sigma factor [Oscillospiraceae bacterium]|nr:sigma-70 family RNA polymerase sigma factor [Oscillospiraceae bacterium]